MLYHFQFELSDIDRGIYESLNFRIVQHPSETLSYLLCRALAYALSYREGLEFSSKGLGDPETPAMLALGTMGATDLWIEIGSPSARKLHKANKIAKQVVVYTYKNPGLLTKEILDNDVHRGQEIKIFAVDPKFLEALEEPLKKNNKWSLLLQQGQLDVDFEGKTFSTEIRHISF